MTSEFSCISIVAFTNDITYLEFTFKPNDDFVSFQYTVASEEYPEYTEYADAFALLVNDVNYAFIPNTKIPVTIGTINDIENPQYYIGINEEDETNAISNDSFVFDGRTIVFSVTAPVYKGVENKIRLTIADKSDYALDSAVFLKAHSITAGKPTVGEFSAYVDTNRDEDQVDVIRNNGSDGYTMVSIVFQDGEGYTIDTKNVEFDDGQLVQFVDIPERAVKYKLEKPIFGAGIVAGFDEYRDIEEIEFDAVFSNQPVDVITQIDSTITLGPVEAVGKPLPTYQWQKKVDNVWTNINGATNVSYSINEMTQSDAGRYRCIATNTHSSAISSEMEVIIEQPPVINTQPVSVIKVLENADYFQASCIIN